MNPKQLLEWLNCNPTQVAFALGFEAACENEAVRAVSEAKVGIPITYRNKVVHVRCVVPVIFKNGKVKIEPVGTRKVQSDLHGWK